MSWCRDDYSPPREIDWDYYYDKARFELEFEGLGAWENGPTESQISYYAEKLAGFHKDCDETSLPETSHQPSINISATLFQPKEEKKSETQLDINLLENRIQQCAKKYLSWGFNNKEKYQLIQNSLQRAKKALLDNSKINLTDFLCTRFSDKTSIKEAFEYGRFFSKSSAFEDLFRILKNDKVEKAISHQPPGGPPLL